MVYIQKKINFIKGSERKAQSSVKIHIIILYILGA